MTVRRVALLLFALGLVGCDHGTKTLAARELAGAPLSIVSGVVDLRFTRNPDTAFSLFERFGVPLGPGVLVGLATAATLLVALTWLVRARRGHARALDHVGYALVLAGAVGNVLDRAFRGYVVDFVRVGAWPVFNVADVAVVVGMGLLALAALRRDRTPDTMKA